jgi:hypothetical protein
MDMTIKGLAFAIGVMTLGLTATAARADYAIVSFNSGYCRIWADTAVAPPDGAFVWFVWGYHRYYRLPTLAIAEYKLHTVVARGLCRHE